MHSLPELQRAFQAGLFGGDAPLALLRTTRGAPSIGFDVYRNNATSNYLEALRDTYPAIEQVVGEGFFAHLAARYACDIPSVSGTLDDFGAGFAAFIADFPGLESLDYVPDLARLEWALHRVFHAADRASLDPAALSSFDADALERARLTLNPAAWLIESPYPILAIWNLAHAAGQHAEGVDLQQGADQLLVLRAADLQPRIHRLDDATFRLLARLDSGASIGDALLDALSVDARFDFGDALRVHLELGTFAGISAC